jgi:hypothetical protein
MMVRYFYGWLPLVFIAAIFILCAPWLGVIALLVLLLAVVALLGAIVWAAVVGLYARGSARSTALRRPAASTGRSAVVGSVKLTSSARRRPC